MFEKGTPQLFVHVVLISFRASATEYDRAWAYSTYKALGNACGGIETGVVLWNVDWNLDQRKGWHLFEFAVFKDQDAFDGFRRHPEHVKAGVKLSAFADWAVGDMSTVLPLKTGS